MATVSSYPTARYRHLPLGVAVLAVLIGIFGFLYVVFGVLAILAVSAFGVEFPMVFGTGLIGGIILLVAGLVLILVASGLWDLELWALVLSIIVVGALWLSDALSGALLSFGGLILLVLLIYLVAVHRQFA